MTTWRPQSRIMVKVLGLAWRGGELLTAEVEDDSGRVKGLRPLGGAVEFGETREEALCREFAEELGCTIALSGPWHAFESIYEHEGVVGHEFIFAANIRLGDQSLYARDAISFAEQDLVPCRAVWISPAALPGGVELYPVQLARMIEAGTVSPSH
jgi:8-oxo-dGTP pyrophosphatase MutT (NUDIX family)